MRTRILNLLMCCALIGVLAAPVLADAITIRMKNGSTWRGDLTDTVQVEFMRNGVAVPFEGTIARTHDLYIVVKGHTATGQLIEKMIFKGDIVSMKTVGEGSGSGATDDSGGNGEVIVKPGATGGADSTEQATSGRGVYVLPLEGTVGIDFRAEEIQDIIDEADEAGPGQIIVLAINSGGGVVVEWEDVAEVILKGKKRHRIVAWIEDAISAAAATALCCDEIYFQSGGVMGAITMHSGGNPVPDAILFDWISRLEKIAREGGRSPYLVGPMVMNRFVVSYDKDEDTGDLTWYPTGEGEFLLSDSNSNLVFNVDDALHCEFADGRADTTDELAVLLNLPAWREVGSGREMAEQWQSTCERARNEIPKLLAKRGYAAPNARARLGSLIDINKQLIGWWRRAPNVCLYEMGLPPVEVLERQIEQWKRNLANMR